jgi:tripartite-type tricarboxylate transporter receptor subunit TctC
MARFRPKALLLAALLCTPLIALAQAFPSKPVRIVVPYPAGGIVDLMARAVSDGLAAKLGQPVLVESRPGADGSIGTEAVARAEPDGHTLLLATIAFAVNPHLSKVPWHPVNDFEGVAHMGEVANIAAVTPSLGVKDLKSLIALARGKAGELNYMNPGNGSSQHLSSELLQQVNDVRLTAINYKGVPPAIPDFLAGTVPFGFFPFGVIAPHLRSGKAQAIAIASQVRHKQFPEIPTMAEQGFASSQVNSFYAFVAPKKTPRAAIERLNRDLNAALALEDTAGRVDKIGGTVIAGWSAERTSRLIADEHARWALVIRKAGLEAK